jgi:hypothetical protein
MPIWAQESLNRTLFERIVNGNLCLGTICSGAGPAMSIRFEPAWPSALRVTPCLDTVHELGALLHVANSFRESDAGLN